MAGNAHTRLGMTAAAALTALSVPAHAQDDALEVEATVLRGRIMLLEEAAAEREDAVEDLEAENEDQRARIARLEAQVETLMSLMAEPSESGGVGTLAGAAPGDEAGTEVRAETPAPQTPPQVAPRAAPQVATVQPAADDVPEAVGQRPEEQVTQPAVQLFAGLGGVLTPKGTVFAEGSLRYATNGDSRFFFSGVEVVQGLGLGVVEARDTQRTAVSATAGLRWGLTSRLEADVSVPFVYQQDEVREETVDGRASGLDSRSSSGLGDVSAGLHLQLNEGRRWPYVIANLRARAPTGTGVFEADADEVATGSDYWSIEPSLTFIKRSDPVVLFGNVGYQFNLDADLDQTDLSSARTGAVTTDGEVLLDGFPADADAVSEFILTETQTEFTLFRPGDAIRASFGLGLALNDRVSMNLGYDQSYILSGRTDGLVTTVRRGEDSGTAFAQAPRQAFFREGSEATVGSFLFGVSYRPADRWRLMLSTRVGATEEAPDASITLTTQARF